MAGDVDMTAREKLMRALLAGVGPTEAARVSGYSRKHVGELRRQPAFMREFERRRDAMVAPVEDEDPDEALALEALRRVAKDLEAPGAAVVAAARELRAVVADRRRVTGGKPERTATAQDDAAAAVAGAKGFLKVRRGGA